MTVEYVGNMNPKPLTSLDEDFKRDRAQFQKDELDRALRRSGKANKPDLEVTYERFPEES